MTTLFFFIGSPGIEIRATLSDVVTVQADLRTNIINTSASMSEVITLLAQVAIGHDRGFVAITEIESALLSISELI